MGQRHICKQLSKILYLMLHWLPGLAFLTGREAGRSNMKFIGQEMWYLGLVWDLLAWPFYILYLSDSILGLNRVHNGDRGVLLDLLRG